VGKDKKAPAKVLVAPAPAKKVKAGEKWNTPTRDVSVNVCIGDLLNHNKQQVVCPTPYRYFHYKEHIQTSDPAEISGSRAKVIPYRDNHRTNDKENQFRPEIQIGYGAAESYTESFRSV